MPKTLVRVSINFPENEWENAREFLIALGRPDLARAPRNPFGYTLKLGDEEQLAQFKALAEMFGFTRDIGVGREKRYSSRELASARLLSVRYTRRARGIGGPESGTQYDFDVGCPCCGTGARQVSDLFIQGRLPDEPGLIETESGEWLLSERFVPLLAECLNGADIVPVRDRRNGELLSWVHLLPSITLPRFTAATSGVKVDRQCSCCARNGHFGSLTEPFELHYPVDVCASADDVVRTWEHFGLSSLRTPRSETVMATPVLVISSRLFRALRAHHVRGLAFTPVVCDD